MQEDQELRASLHYLSSVRKSWDTQNLGESGSGRDVNILRKAMRLRPLLHSEHWALEKKAYFVLEQTKTILAKSRNPANAYTVNSSSPRSIILFFVHSSTVGQILVPQSAFIQGSLLVMVKQACWLLPFLGFHSLYCTNPIVTLDTWISLPT